MSNESVNGVSIEIIHKRTVKSELIQWISKHSNPPDLAIVEPDPRWPNDFETFKSRILAAFESHHSENESRGSETDDNANPVEILSISHVGSTAVPELPAKAVIDIDLVVSSNSLAAEPFYVPCLEATGFQFILRNPGWHEQRLFRAMQPMYCNLHVWGPHSPEVERHRIFRDWLREHDDDRELYAETKRECAALTREAGGSMDDYSERKGDVVQEIYRKAFTQLGYLSR